MLFKNTVYASSNINNYNCVIFIVTFDGKCRYGSDEYVAPNDPVQMSSVSKCQEECAALNTCVAFTYYDDNDCSLYTNGPYTYGDGLETAKCYIMPPGIYLVNLEIVTNIIKLRIILNSLNI